MSEFWLLDNINKTLNIITSHNFHTYVDYLVRLILECNASGKRFDKWLLDKIWYKL